MTPVACEFEAEVLAAAIHGNWDSELRAHVASCAICADVATIGEAIEASRVEGASIPDSGRVWWLAQHRARLEAAEAANWPMLAVQVIALVCLCALLSTYLPSAVTRLWAEHGILALAMAAVLLVVPAAAWLAMGRE
jgi:hypothetical protein